MSAADWLPEVLAAVAAPVAAPDLAAAERTAAVHLARLWELGAGGDALARMDALARELDAAAELETATRARLAARGEILTGSGDAWSLLAMAVAASPAVGRTDARRARGVAALRARRAAARAARGASRG